MNKLIAAFVLSTALVSTTSFAGTPTFAEVNHAMAAGNTTEAKLMLAEVLKKRPESVKAHSINAQLLVLMGAPKQEITKELELVGKLQSKLPYSNPVIEDTEIIGHKSDAVRYTIVALCAASAIIAAMLGWACLNIRGRKAKQKELLDNEADKALYSEQMTSHTTTE